MQQPGPLVSFLSEIYDFLQCYTLAQQFIYKLHFNGEFKFAFSKAAFTYTHYKYFKTLFSALIFMIESEENVE